MKLLQTLGLSTEAIVRNPHASLLVLFVSAFTLFALAGEDNDLIKPKRKKSLYKRLFGVFADDLDDDAAPPEEKHTTVLANVAPEEYSDTTTLEEALEGLVRQLESDLHTERQEKERMRESMKKEEMLRLEAEEALELVKQELNRQVQLYRVHMREERERTITLEKELHGQSVRTQQLEELLKLRELEIEQLKDELRQAQERENKRSAPSSPQSEQLSQESSPLSSSRSKEKRVWTLL